MCAGGAPEGTAPGVRNRHRRGRPRPRGRQLAAGKPSFVRVKEFAEGEARLLLRNCGRGLRWLSAWGCSPEQSLCASPLALTSDGKPPAGSHLTLEGITGLFRVKTVFPRRLGLCQCAGLCVSRAAAGHPGYLQTQVSVDTGKSPAPHFPPLLEPGSWAAEAGPCGGLPPRHTNSLHTPEQGWRS